MRLLITVLILAAAVPSHAQTGKSYSLLPTLRYLNPDYSGNKGLVQEYGGKYYDRAEADFKFATVGKRAYLDLGINALNSGSEDGYLDLNLDSYLSVRGKFSNLIHRQPNLKVGVIMNGRFVSSLDTNTDLNSSLVVTATDYTRTSIPLINRVESEAMAVFSLPGNPGIFSDPKVTAGFWQENESGDTLARYAYQRAGADLADVNRQTRDLSLGVNSGLGEGVISAEFTQRIFEDSADMLVSSVAVEGYNLKVDKPLAPKHTMSLYDVRYRSGLGALIPVTAALSARTRENAHNGYIGNAYSATVAGSYKPYKKTYLVGRVYGRVSGVNENRSFMNDLGKAWGVSGGPESRIDRYNIAADLKARYEYSGRLSFNGGYKFANNYRKNAAHYEEEFTKDATYQDGTYISSNTQSNAVAVHDTRHIITAGLEASLPYDAELSAGYQKLIADRAVFESMPTDQDQIDVSLNMPLPADLTLVTSAGYLAEKNTKSNLTDSNLHQNSYLAGLEWSGTSRVSAGADYSYEQASYRSTGYFGAANNPTGSVWIVNLLREPGMLYRYENNVYGYHAAVKLGRGFSMAGRGSYTISRGAVPVNLNIFRGTTPNAAVVTNLSPTDIRVASGGVSLKYSHGGSRDIASSLGYRRDQWMDKNVSANSGWVNIVNLAVSARF